MSRKTKKNTSKNKKVLDLSSESKSKEKQSYLPFSLILENDSAGSDEEASDEVNTEKKKTDVVSKGRNQRLTVFKFGGSLSAQLSQTERSLVHPNNTVLTKRRRKRNTVCMPTNKKRPSLVVPSTSSLPPSTGTTSGDPRVGGPHPTGEGLRAVHGGTTRIASNDIVVLDEDSDSGDVGEDVCGDVREGEVCTDVREDISVVPNSPHTPRDNGDVMLHHDKMAADEPMEVDSLDMGCLDVCSADITVPTTNHQETKLVGVSPPITVEESYPLPTPKTTDVSSEPTDLRTPCKSVDKFKIVSPGISSSTSQSNRSPMNYWEPDPSTILGAPVKKSGRVRDHTSSSNRDLLGTIDSEKDCLGEIQLDKPYHTISDANVDHTPCEVDIKENHTSCHGDSDIGHTPCDVATDHTPCEADTDHTLCEADTDHTPCEVDTDHTLCDVHIEHDHTFCDVHIEHDHTLVDVGSNNSHTPCMATTRKSLQSSVTSELERQAQLTRKKQGAMRQLSPMQQGLNDTSQSQLSKFYSNKVCEGQTFRIRPLRNPEAVKKATLRTNSMLRKKKNKVENKPAKGILNAFSKSNNTNSEWLNAKKKKYLPNLLDGPPPRLSTSAQLYDNAQCVRVGRVHLGALKMLAKRDVRIDRRGFGFHLMGDHDGDTVTNLSVLWSELKACSFTLDFNPALIAIQPNQMAVTKIVNRISTTRKLPTCGEGRFLNAEAKDEARRYICFELEELPHASVQEGVSQIINELMKNKEIVELSVEQSEHFLKMMSDCVQQLPLVQQRIRPRRSTITKHHIIDSCSSGDEESDLPDYSQSLERTSIRSHGEVTVDMATTHPPTTRRSTRSCVAPRIPLPQIDFTFRPSFGSQAMRVTTDDLSTLQEGEFLNDTIINFYLQYLLDQLPTESRDLVHIFSSFFFTRMSNTKADTEHSDKRSLYDQERLHARVKNWTKSVDIFSKDYLIVPVCHSSHWLVFVVFKPGQYSKEARVLEMERERKAKSKSKLKSRSGILNLDSSSQSEEENGPACMDMETNMDLTVNDGEALPVESCVLTLDSLGSARPNLARRIVNYLNEEWKCKKDYEDKDHFSHIRILRPKIPLQPNSSDCGLYLLHFVQELFKKVGGGEAMLEGDRFCSSEPLEMRRKLISLLKDLNDEANQETGAGST